MRPEDTIRSYLDDYGAIDPTYKETLAALNSLVEEYKALLNEREDRGVKLEKLHAENARLRDAMRDMLDVATGWYGLSDQDTVSEKLDRIIRIGNRALSKEEE